MVRIFLVGAIIRIREMLNFVSICEQSFQRNVIEVCGSRGTGGRTQRFIVIFPALQKISIFNRGDPFVVRLSEFYFLDLIVF